MVSIPKISALYESSLASALSAAGTTFTVVSGSDRDGNALSGLFGFIIDEGSADEEFVVGTISGTTVTISARGIDADSATTEIAGNKKAHRRGASVKITDYPIMGYIRNILNGDTGFEIPNVLTYASALTFTSNNQLITKLYADTIALAGAPDAGIATKGVTRLSVAAASPTIPIAVGDNDTRVSPVSLASVTSGRVAALAGDNSDVTLGASNTFVTQTGLQKGAETYAASSAGSDTYVITLSPVPISYYAGQIYRFKADVANTGAATLNVNSLGAKSILRPDSSALQDGDIAAGQIVSVAYDGTNFLLSSPISNVGNKIYIGVTDVSVINTNVETSLLSVSIPGGTLGTANAIRVRANITRLDCPNASPDSIVLKFKYGSTTLVTTQGLLGTSQSTGTSKGFLEFTLYANASVSAQRGVCNIQTSGYNATPTVSALGAGAVTAGTSTEVSSGALNLVITGQWSNSSSGFTLAGIIVEKIS